MFTVFLIEPTQIIEWGGLLIIMFLIFSETGILLGLVIPGGETLLLAAGLLTGTDTLKPPLAILLVCLITAGILGDLAGYWIGKQYGQKLFHKKDTWYFKKKYLYMTRDFYLKHKKGSLIIGKFLPVIRPFNPVISGTTGIPLATFLGISIPASIIYIGGFVLLGYFLGNEFPLIKKYLGWIIPVSIVIALIPVVMQFRKMRKTGNEDRERERFG